MAALLAGVSLSAVAAHAQDATWLGNTSDWNTATNWSNNNPPPPNVVPLGTAFFGGSGSTTVTFTSLATSIDTIRFNANAQAYTFNLSANVVTINDAGIINNSSFSPTFNSSGALSFLGSSTAANANIVTQAGGTLYFTNLSTAGNATITTNDSSSTLFFGNSTGGNARFITNAGGLVDFSGSLGRAGDGKITAGSIEGAGNYVIGPGNTLIVGSNNLSTEVSGVIADSCSCNPGSGSLVKIGAGTLILSGTNAYTGTTDVNGGTLIVNGLIASSSLTRVNSGGALGGTGWVGNTLTVSLRRERAFPARR